MTSSLPARAMKPQPAICKRAWGTRAPSLKIQLECVTSKTLYSTSYPAMSGTVSSVFQGCYFTLPPLCILRTVQACQTNRNLMMLDVALSFTRRTQNKTRHQPIMNPQESSVLPHRQLRGDSHATRSAPRALDCPDWHHKSSQRWPRLQPLRNPNEPK